ncbi:MAG: T9SS type A sorting domain-containing protein [Saprospiraceae bacterium]|nr:T9SS type A sorting domain-containing protein [Bacteroidia bacterium]NNE13704.1 T9SS type A sorting domain-containing protein [Saprospiraceae bacterium]NNL90975.1 T9SS type A sorting domain-containing protein [Saprospiraceae bacterium]
MKKYLLLSIAFLFMGTFATAQLTNGSTLPGNIVGNDVVSDAPVDVQAWLDEGKSVVIDVFATWCGPCWSFHATGWLDAFNEAYGPDGTDQIRILGVESDGSTPVSAILTNQFGQPGSWVTSPETGDPITYNIIDNPGAASTLGIAYYPTLYIFKPDGTVIEVGSVPGGRYDEDFWNSALGIDDKPNMRMAGSLPNVVICQDLDVDATTLDIFNVSQNTPISSFTMDFMMNGVVESVEYNGPEIAPFNTGSVTIPGFSVSEQSDLSLAVSNINGEAAVVDQELSGAVSKFSVATEKMTVVFTTDYYPGETTWTLEDDLGNFIIGDSYTDGPDAYGGGGDDAHTSHKYEIEVSSDASCLNFKIIDSFGDGLIAWDPSENDPPGIEINDQWGNPVKDNIVEFDANGNWTNITGEGFFRFSDTDVTVNAEQSTAVTNIDELSIFNTYPNPVVDDLTIELAFDENIDFRMDIVDALGNKVKTLGTQTSKNFRSSYDVSDLPSGMYTLAIVTKDGQNVSKFVKM